jgi:phospholipase/carboxylesterase
MGLPAALYIPNAPVEVQCGGRAWWPVDEERRNGQLAQGPRDLSGESPPARDVARGVLKKLIETVRKRHPSLPLVLAGFSQGGMLACDTLLLEDVGVDGLVLMSTSRIAWTEWQRTLHRLQHLPVLVTHGLQDTNLRFHAGEQLRDHLAAIGAHVTWFSFDGGHEIPLTVWRQFRRMVLCVVKRHAAG